jgi:hypothetical protein
MAASCIAPVKLLMNLVPFTFKPDFMHLKGYEIGSPILRPQRQTSQRPTSNSRRMI